MRGGGSIFLIFCLTTLFVPLLSGEPAAGYLSHMKNEINEKIEFPDTETFIKRKKPFTIFVEGIVGTGKSTFIDVIKGYPYVDALPEPVEKWTNLNGSDLLQLLYDDPERWAATQESYVQLTLLEEHLRNVGMVKVMERSVHSARYCFVEHFYQSGKQTKEEYAILDAWYNFLTPQFDLSADLIIYLQVDPVKVWERIKKRGRPEEAHLTLDFLQGLHRLHQDWLFYKNSSSPIPSKNVLVVNTEHPYETMIRIYKMLAKKIWNLIPGKVHKIWKSKGVEY